jgi:hypothetical protein
LPVPSPQLVIPLTPPGGTGQPTTWQGHLTSPSVSAMGNIALLGSTGLLALLIAFLVPFPGTLFNKTVEANYEEIQGWFGRARQGWSRLLGVVFVGPLTGIRTAANGLIGGLLGVWFCIAVTAVIYGFLSPTFGLDADSLAMFLGLFTGFAFITLAFDLPLRVYHRRRSLTRDRGFLRALWLTLPVAVICVVVSRLANFQPGYMYGLIISIIFTSEISSRDEGVATWLASIWLLFLSFVAWILLEVVRQQSGSAWLQAFLETALVTFVVAGIEALAIGLLPMRFLPGHPLFHWRRSMWFPLFALAIFGYLLILVDPVNGYLSNDSIVPMMVGVIFLAAFGLISLSTWAYFRYRPARMGLDRRGEAADPELTSDDLAHEPGRADARGTIVPEPPTEAVTTFDEPAIPDPPFIDGPMLDRPAAQGGSPA